VHHLLMLDWRTGAVDDSRSCDLVRSRCVHLVWGVVYISGLVVLARIGFVGRSHAARRVPGRLVGRGWLHPVDASGRVHDGLLPPPWGIVSRDCCAYRPRIAPPLQLLDPIVEPAKLPIHISRTAVLEINYSLRDGAQDRKFDCQDAGWQLKKIREVQFSSFWRPSTPGAKRTIDGRRIGGVGQCELTVTREFSLKGRPPCQSLVAPCRGLPE
jgi:hypothetical protein